MRFLIQNVLEASVRVEDHITGRIGPGLLVFAGVGPEDDRSVARRYTPLKCIQPQAR